MGMRRSTVIPGRGGIPEKRAFRGFLSRRRADGRFRHEMGRNRRRFKWFGLYPAAAPPSAGRAINPPMDEGNRQGGVPAPLRLRRVATDTYRENVAYLHRDCPVYRAEGFQALAKVEVEAGGAGGGRRVLAMLNVVDDAAVCPPGALGLAPVAEAAPGVRAGSEAAGLEWATARKVREGERSARVTLEEPERCRRRCVCLLDDVASTGRALAEAAWTAGAAEVCAAVTRALFVGEALEALRAAGVEPIWSADTIPHPTNAVSVAPLIAEAVAGLLGSEEG